MPRSIANISPIAGVKRVKAMMGAGGFCFDPVDLASALSQLEEAIRRDHKKYLEMRQKVDDTARQINELKDRIAHLERAKSNILSWALGD